MTNPLRLAAAVLMLGLFAVPAFAAGKSAPAKGDPVIARVNGEDIHRSDFVLELQQLGPQAENIPPQMLYPEVLQKMIATKLAATEGYKDRLQDTKQVRALMKDAENQIVAQAYVRKEVEPKLTDAAIKSRYDELVKKFKPQEEVRARHILFTGPNAEQEAKDAIKKLKAGADFAKLAEQESKDSGSAKNGGDLGYFTREAMVKPFADAAFDMSVGEISDKPIKTEFGWHVIKVEDKRKSSPPALKDVHDQIANQLGQQMTNALIEKLQAHAKVEKFNIDGSPMKTADEKAK
ncbi:MAG TPA: peptidylprolyl isomerase [Alphaproteobacteria bacterium]|nr:peptidylprolyl isomerase [Alphaproteobacteria bacterium]